MSAEHREQRPSEIREVMSDAVRTVSEQSSKLMHRAVQALDDDGQVDVPSLIAAFDLNANLSQAVKQFLESRGQVVFQDGQSVQPPSDKNLDQSITALSEIHDNEGKDEPNLPQGPKTFGELLRAKIERELLPTDKATFWKSEIFEAAKNRNSVKKAAKEEGFSVQKRRFTKEEAVQILYRVFITPSGKFKKKQKSLSLQEINSSFFPSHRDLLDQLSYEINYDWSQNPTVDYQTAMDLRGLAQLEKVVTGEKVAKKGNPEPHFVKKPESLQIQSLKL